MASYASINEEENSHTHNLQKNTILNTMYEDAEVEQYPVTPVNSAEQLADDNEQESNLQSELHGILGCISSMKQQLLDLTKRIRTYERASERKIKTLTRELNKKKRATKQPSGFAKPVQISPSLCEFMNKPYGTEMARTAVTKFIIAYIKTNGLESKENKKMITLDSQLSVLFNEPQGSEIDYFSIQKYMNTHFTGGNMTPINISTTA
jgi:chromatin remodeling complex protein RSC6